MLKLQGQTAGCCRLISLKPLRAGSGVPKRDVRRICWWPHHLQHLSTSGPEASPGTTLNPNSHNQRLRVLVARERGGGLSLAHCSRGAIS